MHTPTSTRLLILQTPAILLLQAIRISPAMENSPSELRERAREKAVQQAGIERALSKETPESIQNLPSFGAIEWKASEMPLIQRGPHAGVSGAGMVVVGGVSDRWSDLALVYDTKDDCWMRVQNPLPTGGLLNDTGVCIIGDAIYVAGGEGPGGSHFNHFLVGLTSPPVHK
jgi:hypothetical protein